MKRSLTLLLILAGFGAAFIAGSWTTGRRQAEGGRQATAERRILNYTCPMHPAYHSDHPGDCPSCGMRLEPVYADGGDKDAPPDASRLVKVSTERQRMIGVRTGLVEESAGRQAIRTVGRVVADETRVYPIFIVDPENWTVE